MVKNKERKRKEDVSKDRGRCCRLLLQINIENGMEG